ncbi:MAG: hypothetical protein ACOYMR_12985 [Ilumatobacteraceae bacterium]
MLKPRKLALAVLASITIAGIAGASASSLGNLNSDSVGSGDTIVASCDSDGMNISYTTGYNAVSGKNEISGVTLTGISTACNGLDATLTLRQGNASLSSTNASSLLVTGTGASATASFSVNGADAALVDGVSLVIQG